MAGNVALPARIARVIRDYAYATTQNDTVKTLRPDAVDGFSSPQETFLSNADHAQIFTNERAAILQAFRRHEAAETERPMGIGTDIQVVPALPKARMVDPASNLDRAMIITAIAIDHGTGRNSIEARG